MLKVKGILITRGAEQGNALAQALAKHNVPSVVVPALIINPIDYNNPNCSDFHKLIYISQNAVKYGPKPSEKNIVCAIGTATSQALKNTFAINQLVVPSEATSEALLEDQSLQSVSGENILIICGKGGRALLQDTLRERGALCQRLEVYERCYPEENENLLQTQLENGKLDFVLVTSEQALKNTLQLSGQYQDSVRTLQPIVISSRLARLTKELGFKQTAIIINTITANEIYKAMNQGVL